VGKLTVGSNPTPSARRLHRYGHGVAATTPPIGREALDHFMDIALDEARLAATHDDVPIGAVVVSIATGEVVARRHNERELAHDPTSHAEILALRDAAVARGTWRLDGHALIVTLEPCPMCAGAAVAARLDVVAFGAPDPKAGAMGSLYNLGADPRLNHELSVVGGIRADECSSLLTEFFEARRASPRAD
jgi:tRNA(adenine34) deaminase